MVRTQGTKSVKNRKTIGRGTIACRPYSISDALGIDCVGACRSVTGVRSAITFFEIQNIYTYNIYGFNTIILLINVSSFPFWSLPNSARSGTTNSIAIVDFLIYLHAYRL